MTRHRHVQTMIPGGGQGVIHAARYAAACRCGWRGTTYPLPANAESATAIHIADPEHDETFRLADRVVLRWDMRGRRPAIVGVVREVVPPGPTDPQRYAVDFGHAEHEAALWTAEQLIAASAKQGGAR